MQKVFSDQQQKRKSERYKPQRDLMNCCWLEDGRSHLTKNRSDLLEALRVPQLTTSRNTGTSGPRSQGTGFFQQQQWDWKLILSWGVSVRKQPGWYLDFCLLMPWAENSVESACISEVQTFELINGCDFKLLSLDHLYHSSRELMYHYNPWGLSVRYLRCL